MVSGLRDTTNKQIKYKAVNLASSGDAIAAVTGKKICVVYWHLSTSAATTLTFQSGGSTALTGDIGTLADDPIQSGYCPDCHFQTVAGEKLNLVAASGSIDGYIVYYEE